jgi:hypothetical protein
MTTTSYTRNFYRSAVTLSLLRIITQMPRGMLDDYRAAVEELQAFPEAISGPEHVARRRKQVKDALRRLKDERDRRLMVAVLDFTNGSRDWVWIRRNALEEEHLGWLIQTDYQHLLRHVGRLNDHLEEAHEWGFTALDGRRFEIRERRLRP